MNSSTSVNRDEELLVRVISVLLQATPAASAVAIASANVAGDADDGYTILHYDSRVPDKDGPTISARLVKKAVDRRESILHLWSPGTNEKIQVKQKIIKKEKLKDPRNSTIGMKN